MKKFLKRWNLRFQKVLRSLSKISLSLATAYANVINQRNLSQCHYWCDVYEED